jgi:hypothetical protein
VAVRWAAPGLARGFRSWQANTVLRLVQRRALSHWQGGLLRRVFSAWRGGVGRHGHGRSRWHRLIAFVHLLEWIVVHPREDIHNLAHPLETYRRLHSSGTGLGTGTGTGTGTDLGTGTGTGLVAKGGKGPSASGGKGPPLARRHSHAGAAQGSTATRLPRRRAASVAPMLPVEHPSEQRRASSAPGGVALSTPPASGSRAILSDAAASTADLSASASAAAPPPHNRHHCRRGGGDGGPLRLPALLFRGDG